MPKLLKKFSALELTVSINNPNNVFLIKFI